MKFKLAFVATALSLAAASGVSAQTINLGVSATVGAACVLAQTPIAFGVYNPAASVALDATGNLSLACTTGSTPNITIGLGLNPLAGARRLASGTDFLNYSVFQPLSNAPGAACAFVTAYPIANTGFVLTAAPSTAARIYNVCGRIPAGQTTATAGNYADTVIASIAF